MLPNRSSASRWAAHAVLAGATGLGLWLFGLGVLDQWSRWQQAARQGLGFADPFCTTGYCDYAMFWVAGFLVRHGQSGLIYHHAAYAAVAARILPYPDGWWPFVYPPVVLPPAALIAAAPLVTGYYGFSLAATSLSICLLRRAGIVWVCILFGLISPAAMWNLYLGQIGLLCGALLVYGLARMETRPLSAGGALGLLCIKPQYALLVPFAVAAGRHGRATQSGIAMLVLCIVLSMAIAGPSIWLDYLGPGRAEISTLLTQKHAGYQSMGTSVFWMLRSLQAPLTTAIALQAAASALAASLCWHLWRGPGDAARIPLTVFLTLLASPYGFTDDLAIYSVLLPCLACRKTPWRNAGLACLWVAPAFVPKFVALCGFLPTPLLVMGAIALTPTERKALLFVNKKKQKNFD